MFLSKITNRLRVVLRRHKRVHFGRSRSLSTGPLFLPKARPFWRGPDRLKSYQAIATKRPPFDNLGFATAARTYFRVFDDNNPEGPLETWNDMCVRVVENANEQLGCGLSLEEKQELFGYIHGLEGFPGGRFLSQLGGDNVARFGMASLQNCAVTVVNRPIRPFTWTFSMLMSGCGVGFNMQEHYVRELPRVHHVKITRQDTKDADFIVPDSREGWCALLHEVLKAHFETGKSFSYSCVCIRSKGAPIRGFGGTASGPDILATGMEEINRILNRRAGEKIRPIDVLDIITTEGRVVKAGNVRRSALIAIGDQSDIEFLRAKRWDLGNIPVARGVANNSIICNDIREIIDNKEFWAPYEGQGEKYGMLNMRLSKEMGRLGELRGDPAIVGFNPCGEQPLANWETCCLSDIVLPRMRSQKHLMGVAVLLYRVAKHSLRLPCQHPETERIVHEHMRMGIGITGFMQATEEQKSWLDPTYRFLREFDAKYSADRRWPQSIRLTTGKPSGTLGCMAGCTNGVNPGFAHQHVRMMRMASSLDLVRHLRANGHPVEPAMEQDGSLDHDTTVVSFPREFPKHTVCVSGTTAISQLNAIRFFQEKWSDNAVSNTVMYHPEELPGIKQWLLQNYNSSIKSVSFLTHSGHGFIQAPEQLVSPEEFGALQKRIRPLDYNNLTLMNCVHDDALIREETLIQQGESCAGGSCPVR